MTIAIVTDSSSQLSPDEVSQLGIHVVPIPIIIDGHEFQDGINLDADSFYERLSQAGEGVQLSTSQPSPGEVSKAWTAAVEAGADRIISIHVGQDFSGTINSAQLVADQVSVPVHLIDSKTTSYGLGIVVREVVQWLDRGGNVDGLDAFAEQLIAQIGTVFILQDLRYILKGGRMRQACLPAGSNDIPVLGGMGGGYQLLGTGRTIDELVDQMAASLLGGDHQRHVAIAHAAPDTLEFTEKLEAIMHASPIVESVHRYRMGPAIAVHTGPGTAGGFHWPVLLPHDC